MVNLLPWMVVQVFEVVNVVVHRGSCCFYWRFVYDCLGEGGVADSSGIVADAGVE